MRSFITGSHAYGLPQRDSDIDLVILCDEATKAKLLSRSEDTETDLGKRVIRFGKLNVIACVDEREYAVWKVGTEACRAEKEPVSRDDAKAFFDSLRAQVGIRDNY